MICVNKKNFKSLALQPILAFMGMSSCSKPPGGSGGFFYFLISWK